MKQLTTHRRVGDVEHTKTELRGAPHEFAAYQFQLDKLHAKRIAREKRKEDMLLMEALVEMTDTGDMEFILYPEPDAAREDHERHDSELELPTSESLEELDRKHREAIRAHEAMRQRETISHEVAMKAVDDAIDAIEKDVAKGPRPYHFGHRRTPPANPSPGPEHRETFEEISDRFVNRVRNIVADTLGAKPTHGGRPTS